MEARLTQGQLTKIVGEVERLSQQRQAEIDRNQLEEILRELGLPSELLDDALIQLQRREALAVQQKRRRWIVGSVIASLVVGMAGIGFWVQQHQQLLARVSAQQDRVALVQEPEGNVTTVSRQTNPELLYQVTLKDAPVNNTLDLSCDWIAPSGEIVQQNRYRTRKISTTVWETHCRYRLGAAASVGTWQVRMFLGDRRLSDALFTVK